MGAGPPLPPRHPEAPAVDQVIEWHSEYCAVCGQGNASGLRMIFFAGPGLSVHSALRLPVVGPEIAVSMALTEAAEIVHCTTLLPHTYGSTDLSWQGRARPAELVFVRAAVESCEDDVLLVRARAETDAGSRVAELEARARLVQDRHGRRTDTIP